MKRSSRLRTPISPLSSCAKDELYRGSTCRSDQPVHGWPSGSWLRQHHQHHPARSNRIQTKDACAGMRRQSADANLPQQCALFHPKQATAQRVSGSRDQQTLSQGSPPPFAAMRKFLCCEFQLTQCAPHSTRAFCERNSFRMRKSCIRSIGSGPCVGNGQRTRAPPPFAAMRNFLNCEFPQTQCAPHLIHAFCERNYFRMRTSVFRSTGSRPDVGIGQRTTSCGTSGTTPCNRVSPCLPALAAAPLPRTTSRRRRLLRRAQHRYAEKLLSLARIYYGNELRHWARRYKELTFTKSEPQDTNRTLSTPHKPCACDFVRFARNLDVKRSCRPTFPYPVNNFVFLPADISGHPPTQSKYKIGGADQPVDFLSK